MKNLKIKKYTINSFITYAIVIAFFVFAMFYAESGMYKSNTIGGMLIPIVCYIIMAVSLNLIVGVLGELSLGHAGFMCLGAYVGAIFSIITEEMIPSVFVRYGAALLLGGLIAGIIGLFIGMSTLRLRGDYLAIVTLAFGEIIYKLMQNCYLAKDVNGYHFSFGKELDLLSMDLASKQDILKGAQAVSGVPKDATIISSLIILLVILVLCHHLVDSRAGRAFKAIRDNRIAAESIGIHITKYKLIAFFLSAFIAGVAGSMFAHCTSISASKFNYDLSILVLVFVVLGGIGSIRGSIIATILLYALPELLREFQTYRMLIYAIILIVMMILNNNAKVKVLKEQVVAKICFWKKPQKEWRV